MRNMLRKELIGSEIKVIDSKNMANIGIEGRIIDETKNMLMVDTEKGVKKLIKEDIMIKLLKDGITISGKLLASRPEDRIKKKI